MINIASTKLYKNNQTSVPSKLIKELNLKPDTLIDWNKNNNGDIILKFRNKELSFNDLAGIGHSEEVTNAVELKRRLYNE